MGGIGSTRSAAALAFAALLGLSHAFPAAALDREDLAAAREAYAKAAGPPERQTTALHLGLLLLRRATNRPAASQQPPMPDQPAPSAAAELTEAEHLFREAAAGGGHQADEGEAGVLAALLARGPGGASEVNGELQRLQQRGRGTGVLLCMAMKDLLQGFHRDAMLAAGDLVDDHVHALLPAAPYVSSTRVSRPEALAAPMPGYPEQARKDRERGHVVFQAVIDEHGQVADFLIIRPAPTLLAEVAAKALRRWTFRPALRDGKAVPFCFQPVITFTVQ